MTTRCLTESRPSPAFATAGTSTAVKPSVRMAPTARARRRRRLLRDTRKPPVSDDAGTLAARRQLPGNGSMNPYRCYPLRRPLYTWRNDLEPNESCDRLNGRTKGTSCGSATIRPTTAAPGSPAVASAVKDRRWLSHRHPQDSRSDRPAPRSHRRATGRNGRRDRPHPVLRLRHVHPHPRKRLLTNILPGKLCLPPVGPRQPDVRPVAV